VTLLNHSEISHALSKHHDWRINDGALWRVFDFNTFAEAIQFVNQIGQFSEQVDHHPDIDIRFRQVSLSLTTKSAGGVTQLDLDWIERWTQGARDS